MNGLGAHPPEDLLDGEPIRWLASGPIRSVKAIQRGAPVLRHLRRSPQDHPEVIAAAVNDPLAPPTSEEPR